MEHKKSTNSPTIENKKEHIITIKNTNEIAITGVNEVLQATETNILAKTDYGPLQILGRNIKVSTISIETGLISATGEFVDIKYSSNQKSFFQKVFK